MNAKTLKSKSGRNSAATVAMDDDYYSSDEFNYDEEIDSDDEEHLEQPQQTTIATRSKRLKTSQHDVSVSFRKTSSSSSITGGSVAEERVLSSKSIERMPTRRPNPKICNRNAVMARENRRKKKEYLENLQRDVDEFQSENKKLRKLLTIRNNMITKLTNESMYLKSVLANKTEIMALLKSIQGSRVPITSSTMSFVTDPQPLEGQIKRETTNSYATSSSGCSPASSFSPSPSYIIDHDDEKENGTDWIFGDPLLSSASLSCPATINQGFLFTDLDNHFSLSDHDLGWESLLMNNSNDMKCSMRQQPFCIADLRDIDDSEILSTNGSHNVNHEHNYFNNPVKPTKGTQPSVAIEATTDIADDATCMRAATVAVTASQPSAPGVCLHVSGGRVSLEFCAACHLNSQNAWIEE